MTDITPLVQGRFVQPETVVTHFHLREGDKVADFGAGKGYFIPVLSEHVGQSGKVYACEIQKNLTEAAADLIKTKELGNVEVLWCDVEASGGCKLADGGLDTVVVINSLFQMEDKATALQEMLRALKSGGKLFIVDWSESFGGLGPQPDQVITQEQTKTLAESNNFVFERSFDAGDHHYGVAFRKV